MTNKKLDKKQLEDLSKQIKRDQAKDAPAEKRVKIETTFGKAIKKMAQTPSPSKKTDKSI